MRQKVVTSAVAMLALVVVIVAGLTAGPSLFDGGKSRGSEPAVTDPDPGTPVVLVILDELPTGSLMRPDGTIDQHRFPVFAKLASQSTWYRDHVAAGDFTAWAVPPILTGNHVNQEILPTDAVQPDNIFNLLGPGRRVHSLEEVTELCPKRICPDGHQGEHPEERFADDFIKAKFKLVEVGEINRWIKGMPAGRRTLSVIHLPLPHAPHRFLPNGKLYPGGPLGFTIPKYRNDWTIPDAGITLVQQRHLLQAGFADLMLGRILKKIRKNGSWDESMVIVTADHGHAFDARYDRRDAAPPTVAATVNPPLMIKYPGQKAGFVSTRSTQAIDIVPTIAEQLGVKDLYPTDGLPIDRVPADRVMMVNKDEMAEIQVTADQVREQRPEYIRESRRRFGGGGLWRLSTHPQLLDRRVGKRPAAPGDATIDSPERYVKVRPRADRVPSFVTGTTTGVPLDTTLAVAVNGRIAATGRNFPYEGADRFGVMVKPSYFRPGRNRIAVYTVSPDDRLRRLR